MESALSIQIAWRGGACQQNDSEQRLAFEIALSVRTEESAATDVMAPATMIQTPLRSGRTGDLDGNLARIDRELRRIRFPVDFDEDGAKEGSPMSLLPALHYAMLGFSRHVTRSLSDEGHDLQAKSDSRFVENAWKALRESFHYNPTLTPVQFLSPGFAERKLLLLADAIELCKRRHNEHARAARAADVKAVVAKEGGPRVARERASQDTHKDTKHKDTEGHETKAGNVKRRTPGRPIQIRRDGGSHAGPTNAATLGTSTGVANLRVSTEPMTAENSDDDDDEGGNFEFRPSPSPNRVRPPLTDLAASGDAPPWFARSAALRSQASSIAIDPTHDERDSFTVRESRESLLGARSAAVNPDDSRDFANEPAPVTAAASGLESVRRSGGFPDENYPTVAPVVQSVDYTPLFEALRDDVGAVAKKAGEAEARAVDAERRAAVAVDVANNAEGRACAAEEAAADARNECDEIARRLAASNAALAEQGARAFLLEGRVRILEEALKGRHESEESPLEEDEYQPRDAVEDTEPVEDTRVDKPDASSKSPILTAAPVWPDVRDSPWAYQSPSRARKAGSIAVASPLASPGRGPHVRDSDQSYFAPPTVAGVAAGVFADDASDWDATVNSSAEWGESSPLRSSGFKGVVGASQSSVKTPGGIDAGAFVDYYSKLLSTTEETLRKTKGGGE